MSLYDRTGFNLHIVGGAMRPASGSMTGEDAARFIERYSLDLAVIGTCGIDGAGSLLDYDQSLVPPLLAMIANARETILVADASKFAASGIVRGPHLRDVDHLVTSAKPSGAIANLLAEHAGGCTTRLESCGASSRLRWGAIPDVPCCKQKRKWLTEKPKTNRNAHHE